MAKTRFASAVHAIPPVRGIAKRPLYVTAVGITLADAAELVRVMMEGSASRTPCTG